MTGNTDMHLLVTDAHTITPPPPWGILFTMLTSANRSPTRCHTHGLWGRLDVVPNSLKRHWRRLMVDIQHSIVWQQLWWAFLQSACQLHTPSTLTSVALCCVTTAVCFPESVLDFLSHATRHYKTTSMSFGLKYVANDRAAEEMSRCESSS